MNGLWRVIVKEFLQLRQDRRILGAMIAGPVLQLLALGYAATTDVNHVPTLLVDEDRTPASRALADRFTGSGYFSLVAAADTAAQVEPWLIDGRAQVALVIPARYGEQAAAGRTPRIQVIADGSDANSAVVGLGYAAKIVQQLGAELVAARTGRPARERVALDARIWYNPDLRSRWFYVPAVLAIVLLLVTMILPSMAVVREKENGTLEQISVTPLRPWQLILGKLLPFVLIGLVDLLLVVALARWPLGVPLRGSLALLMLLTLLYLLSTLGLGLLVSTLVQNQQQAMMFSAFVLMVPMIYLGGLLFPIENMPHAIQLATYAVPVRYYAHIIRGVFLKGTGLSALWPDALALAGIGLALVVLAVTRFRKSLD